MMDRIASGDRIKNIRDAIYKNLMKSKRYRQDTPQQAAGSLHSSRNASQSPLFIDLSLPCNAR